MNLYETAGVREYVIAVTSDRQLLWKELSRDGYRPLEPDDDGVSRSRFFPGLWLDPEALWTLDQARLLGVLQEGLATPEHAAFVAQMSGARR